MSNYTVFDCDWTIDSNEVRVVRPDGVYIAVLNATELYLDIRRWMSENPDGVDQERLRNVVKTHRLTFETGTDPIRTRIALRSIGAGILAAVGTVILTHLTVAGWGYANMLAHQGYLPLWFWAGIGASVATAGFMIDVATPRSARAVLRHSLHMLWLALSWFLLAISFGLLTLSSRLSGPSLGLFGWIGVGFLVVAALLLHRQGY
jgi:hypothetical protein